MKIDRRRERDMKRATREQRIAFRRSVVKRSVWFDDDKRPHHTATLSCGHKVRADSVGSIGTSAICRQCEEEDARVRNSL